MFRKYPGLLILAGVLSCILVADASRMPTAVFLLAAVVLLLAGLWLVSARRPRQATIIFALSLGAAAAAGFSRKVYDVPPGHIARVTSDGRMYQILGRVADWPEIRAGHTEVTLAVDSLGGRETRRTSGNILLKITDTTTGLQRGDRVELWGRIYSISAASNAPRFDYGRYLNLKGVFGVVYVPTLLDVRIDRRNQFSFFALIDKFRDWIRGTLYADLSPQAAALASGFLIGETRDIPTGVYQAFRNSGTLHLMAVSGSNVAVVLACFYLISHALGLSRGKRAIALLAVVVCFAALSYGEPSVLRASVMAALVILATLLERRYDLNNITALAMLLILLFDPTQLFDVGFQLSFVTAWGLIVIVPRLTPLFKRYHNTRWYRWIMFPVLISLVAQVCSAPLTAYYFGRIPLLSLIANLLIVPLASGALVLILLVLIAQALLPVVGMVVGSLADLLLVLTLRLVGLFGGAWSPALQVDSDWPLPVAAVCIALLYLLIVLAVLSVRSRRSRRLLAATLLVAINAGLALAGAQRTASATTMHMVTTPGGVSALVTYNDGSADLIVSNLSAKPYATDEKIFLPLLRKHEVEKLRRMFVLSVSYESLDDLLRLADTTAAEAVYLPSNSQRSCQEITREVEWPDSLVGRLRFFGGSVPAICEGYNLSRDNITLWNRSGSVTVTNSANVARMTPLPAGSHMLIVGKSWKATGSDWSTLRQIGYSQVICPKVAQVSEAAQAETDPEPDIEPPDFVKELFKTGEFDLQVSDLSIVPSP